MIEITAQILSGSVCLTGDNVVCNITFTNRGTSETSSRYASANLETLAWASAQIHCLCSTNSKTPIPLKTSPQGGTPSTMSDTCFSPYKTEAHGQVVFSTKPKILFCDLQLPPGLTKSFIYSETIPNEAPPSYRGQLVKYSYKITVGAQRVNCPTRLLWIPLRVLAISGVPDYNTCEDSEDLSPNNPFLESRERENELGPALQIMQNITARRNPNFYNITNRRGKVGRFCLFKQAYRLGEDIVGTFDFTKSTVPCIQVNVTLQCDEKISTHHRKYYKFGIATASYSKFHEVCLYVTHCNLNLPIPLYATPAFTTDLVSLYWKLHFEFVTCKPGLTEIRVNGHSWQAPGHLNIETMVWDLPIQIYPTIPTPEPSSKIPHSIHF